MAQSGLFLDNKTLIIIESVSGGFCRFVGYCIMVGLFLSALLVPFKLIMFLVNRPLRHYPLRKNGYPPPHCDAYGDFKS